LSVAAGDVVKAVLYWRTEAVLDRDYKVSLRLRDSVGKVVAVVDRSAGDGLMPSSIWKPGETVTDRHGLLVPRETPSGEYQLVVKLYDPGTLTEVVDATLGPVWIKEQP